MHEAIYQRLIEVARARRTIHYSEIAPLADLDMESPADRNRIAAILDEISRHEHDHGRPLLSGLFELLSGSMHASPMLER